jgi:hypothetical protein
MNIKMVVSSKRPHFVYPQRQTEKQALKYMDLITVDNQTYKSSSKTPKHPSPSNRLATTQPSPFVHQKSKKRTALKCQKWIPPTGAHPQKEEEEKDVRKLS